MPDADEPSELASAWRTPEPRRLVGRGHHAGDFIEAYKWEVLVETEGRIRVSCHLPDQVLNPRGQLFGGFTPTYVDFISLHAVRAGQSRASGGRRNWLATTNMRVDYFEPIVGPTFVMDSTLEKSRGRTKFVTTRFYQDDVLAVHAVATMREVDTSRTIGDG